MNIIGIRLAQKNNAVNEPADPKQTKCEQIENASACFSFVEFVGAQITKEETQEKCDPFVFNTNSKHCGIYVCISVCVVVSVINYNAGLLCVFDFFYLTAAVCTNNSCCRDFCTAVLTKLGVFLCSIANGGSRVIHIFFFLSLYFAVYILTEPMPNIKLLN
jgi:hypothetical protein